ncbi:hypothetical protein [Paenibacillus sp. GCM10027626]|uniref:hypothetical protein n=1 Tax=Paenibacillus sp. GCM10027626 TaxID=3273411 RepID=UPI00364149DA
MLEEKKTEATEAHEEKEKSIISRRKLLASLGMAGAALTASTIVNGTGMKAFANPRDQFVQLNTASPFSANNYATIQSAVDTSPVGNEIVINTGSYTQSVDVNRSNLKGKGYGTVLNVPSSSYGVKALQTIPNWDRTKISDMTIKGITRDSNIGVLFDPNDAVAGRKALSFMSFSNLDVAISKPKGHIGNTYANIDVYECNYGIKALSVAVPIEMHSGNDTWTDFQMDNIDVYAFDYTDTTGGGAIHIKDGIIEYCKGGGIRLEYSASLPPFIPPRISNVWLEQVATASSIVRDGITEVPRAIKLVNTAMCIIDNCKLDNIELVNSTAIATNCRVDSSNIVLDATSNLIVENAFINGSVPNNVTVTSIAKQAYPSARGGNLMLRGNDIVGVERTPQNASAAVGVTYIGNVGKQWVFDGTALVYAQSVIDDSGAQCAQLPLDPTRINVLPSVVTPANHWVVWGISAKPVGDFSGEFKFNYDYNLGDIILEKDNWVHSFGIAKAPTVDMRIGARFTPTMAGAIRLRNYFIVSFAKEADAIAFVNSRIAINTYPDTVQVSYDPPSLAAGATSKVDVDFLGISVGDNVTCSFSKNLSGTRMWAEVTNQNVVSVYLNNPTTAVVDLSEGTLTVKLI